MSIKLKELVDRKYEDKEPMEFRYNLDLGKDDRAQEMYLQFHFQRAAKDSNVWMLTTKIARVEAADSQCYYIGYEMPRSGLPLELICATGLRYFKLQMQSEIQLRTNIDFSIGAVTEGM